MDALPDLGESRSITLSMSVPFERDPAQVRFRQPGDAVDRVVDAPEVTTGYFDVLRIPIVAGRTFDPADEGRNVIVIDEPLAAELWPRGSALGNVIVIEGIPREVVGVVKGADTGGRFFRGRRMLSAIYRPLGRTSLFRGNVPQALVHGPGPTVDSSFIERVTRISIHALRSGSRL